jgi:hypothetical protein
MVAKVTLWVVVKMVILALVVEVAVVKVMDQRLLVIPAVEVAAVQEDTLVTPVVAAKVAGLRVLLLLAHLLPLAEVEVEAVVVQVAVEEPVEA